MLSVFLPFVPADPFSTLHFDLCLGRLALQIAKRDTLLLLHLLLPLLFVFQWRAMEETGGKEGMHM